MYNQANLRRSLAIITFISALLVSSAPTNTNLAPYPLTVITEFANPNWIENIAVQSNGDLILSSFSSPSIFLVDPFTGKPPVLVASIPQAMGVSGLAELEKDVFYAAVGNFSGITPVQGTFAVWRIDLRPLRLGNSGQISKRAKIEHIATLREAVFLNGMCRLASTNNCKLLISDSILGSVFLLDVCSKSYSLAITDDTMSARGASSGFPVGVNGVHVYGRNLFFTNLAKGTFFKVPLSLMTGMPTGPFELIVDGIAGDDFALSEDGKKGWIAANPTRSLVEVDIAGKTKRTIAGSQNTTDLADPTSVGLGRTAADSNFLYVVTNGGAASPAALGVTGGRVVRIPVPA